MDAQTREAENDCCMEKKSTQKIIWRKKVEEIWERRANRELELLYNESDIIGVKNIPKTQMARTYYKNVIAKNTKKNFGKRCRR